MFPLKRRIAKERLFNSQNLLPFSSQTMIPRCSAQNVDRTRRSRLACYRPICRHLRIRITLSMKPPTLNTARISTDFIRPSATNANRECEKKFRIPYILRNLTTSGCLWNGQERNGWNGGGVSWIGSISFALWDHWRFGQVWLAKLSVTQSMPCQWKQARWVDFKTTPYVIDQRF